METPKSKPSAMQMSSSLKERLKRCGRYRSSPLTGQLVKKVSPEINSSCLQGGSIPQLKHNSKEERTSICQNDQKYTLTAGKDLLDSQESGIRPSTSEESDNCRNTDCASQMGFVATSTSVKHGSQLDDLDVNKLELSKLELKGRIQAKEEESRKLRMVKFYRAKNDIEQLDHLVGKWKNVCQESINELLNIAPEPKPTIMELIDYFKLDHKMIGFNKEDESFASSDMFK